MVKYQYLSKLTVVHPYNAMLSAMERNKLMIHARKWMNLKCIMLNERNQIEKTHMPDTYVVVWKKQNYT